MPHMLDAYRITSIAICCPDLKQEGYSPTIFRGLLSKAFTCLTDHKVPDWIKLLKLMRLN